MKNRISFLVVIALMLATAFVGTMPTFAAGVVGTGTAASCTEAAFDAALIGGGAVTFNCGGPATITITSTKNITANTSIDGNGAITISGGGAVSVFRVNAGVSLDLVSLTVSNGNDGTVAGGINNYGTLTLTKTNITWNHGGNAGGLYNKGTAHLTSSSVEGNQGGLAAGILNEGTLTVSYGQINKNVGGAFGGFANAGSATIYDTSIRANTGQGVGGVENYAGAGMQIVRSLVSDNVGASPSGSVAGVRNYGGKLAIANSTIANNQVSSLGDGGLANFNGGWTGLTNVTIANNRGTSTGGLENGGGNIQLSNTIVGRNAGTVNCTGSITNSGHNLQFPDGTCGAGIPNADPMLDTLNVNGGPTLTHALLPGSPAIDNGDSGLCASPPINNVDQRSYKRSIDGNGDGVAICDIGAFELQ